MDVTLQAVGPLASGIGGGGGLRRLQRGGALAELHQRGGQTAERIGIMRVLRGCLAKELRRLLVPAERSQPLGALQPPAL
jgi:hypothetical protein